MELDSSATPEAAILNNNRMVIRIIWAAMTATQLMFVFVIFVTIKNSVEKQAELTPGIYPLFPIVFGVLSIFVLAMSIYIPAMILKIQRSQRKNKGEALSAQEIAQRILLPNILRFALIESVGVFGFLLAMITKEPRMDYPFLAAALTAMLLAYPSDEKISANLQD
jgi:uncharacterized integral membrane protein